MSVDRFEQLSNMQDRLRTGAMRCRPSGGMPVGTGIRPIALFRLTKRIVNALGSMPICIEKKVIFRMLHIGTDGPVTL
jgi:hypothetical protein